MVQAAVAREAVCALRRQIAGIEGRLPLPSACDAAGETVALRRNGRVCAEATVSTGAAGLDRALGGGVPDAALLELHGAAMRDAAAAAGFGLALAGLRLRQAHRPPVLWIAPAQTLHEAGAPYLCGLRTLLGAVPGRLLLARAKRLEDALWLAEEGLGVAGLGAVILEASGASPRLDLTATRRLAARAKEHRCLLLLIRQGAPEPMPTAAPLRLLVAPAPARPRETLAGPLRGTIGPPAFRVTVSKNRSAPPVPLLLDWNPHERRFSERPQNPGAVAALPRHGAGVPQETGAVVALEVREPAAAGAFAQGRQRLDDRGRRRAG